LPMLRAEAPTIEVGILNYYRAKGDEQTLRILLGAIADLPVPPQRNIDDLIEVPQNVREQAEDLLQHSANMLAVAHGVKRHLASPMPCLGLKPESRSEEQLLQQSAGIVRSLGPGLPWAKGSIDSPALERLVDRLDGVALLAEAISAGTALGEFHELIRVFERAFSLGGRSLVLPLSQFLESAEGLGYTRSEVHTFLKTVRDQATHADRRKEFLLESDVRPVIARTRQAAYDVLFNKETWRSPSSERRVVWTPLAGLADPDVPFIVKGSNVVMQLQVMDEFGVFPHDLSNAANQVPEGWWSWSGDKVRQTNQGSRGSRQDV
jgi:hypothetical protein